jgi:hypothetical protein
LLAQGNEELVQRDGEVVRRLPESRRSHLPDQELELRVVVPEQVLEALHRRLRNPILAESLDDSAEGLIDGGEAFASPVEEGADCGDVADDVRELCEDALDL